MIEIHLSSSMIGKKKKATLCNPGSRPLELNEISRRKRRDIGSLYGIKAPLLKKHKRGGAFIMPKNIL